MFMLEFVCGYLLYRWVGVVGKVGVVRRVCVVGWVEIWHAA